MFVDSSITTAVITRESGLRPLTMSTFEVRVCSGDDVSEERKTVSTFVCKLYRQMFVIEGFFDALSDCIASPHHPI